jgi:hypothetical protein
MSTKHHTTTIHKIGILRESEVTLFDCNCHTYLEAVGKIVSAIKCSYSTAVLYAETAQMFGQVTVFKGLKEDCEKVASVLSSTGLTVSII